MNKIINKNWHALVEGLGNGTGCECGEENGNCNAQLRKAVDDIVAADRKRAADYIEEYMLAHGFDGGELKDILAIINDRSIEK